MTDNSGVKPWASTDNLLVVLCECVIAALMTLRYLHPGVATAVIMLVLGGYVISVFGPGPRRNSVV
jgi:hypothetical protein